MKISGQNPSPMEMWIRRKNMALLTDFYELTMLQGYWKTGRGNQQVAFEYFFRNLPSSAGFAITAGL
ncbi:MAG: hypothetical protein P9M03_07395, partial [Candidatus Theseobacter exili]|nr:hypothetical protein [Candidatus Theseobacter exili]